MHFFQWIRWGGLFHQPVQPQSPQGRRHATTSKVRAKPQHDGKMEPVLTVLELREMIGCFVADVALAAGGVAVVRRMSDPTGESAWLDFSVSGGFTDWEHALALSATGKHDAGIVAASSSPQPDQASGPSNLSSAVTETQVSPQTPREQPSTLGNSDPLSSAVIVSVLDDAVPRPHEDFGNLSLARPAGGGAGSSGVAATTNGATVRRNSDIEIPSAGGQPWANSSIATEPFVPPSPRTTNGPNGPAPSESIVVSPLGGAAGMDPGNRSEAQTDASGNGPVGSSVVVVGSGAMPSGGAGSAASPIGGGPPFGLPGKNCSVGGPPGHNGGGQPTDGADQPGGGLGLAPAGPPFVPPGRCSQSSLADPLFVLDWNDGLVLFADVKEYEFPGKPVVTLPEIFA